MSCYSVQIIRNNIQDYTGCCWRPDVKCLKSVQSKYNYSFIMTPLVIQSGIFDIKCVVKPKKPKLLYMHIRNQFFMHQGHPFLDRKKETFLFNFH